GSLVILLLLHPFVLHNALRIMSKKFPKFVVQPENLPGFKQMVFLVLRYCLIWILQGLGFWCALKSLATIPFSSLWPVLGGNALAWLAGFVVVFTPAGLGVREIVLTRINVGTVGAGPAALVAIMARFFMIFSELIVAFLIFLFQLKKRDIKDNPSRVA
ncbi:lysylphosphatidylglycerol synthase domain-containing protein, partial [bacterium]|nr:lysylphosphatidylglycerol synthase domain-containing protein [bacterium]